MPALGAFLLPKGSHESAVASLTSAVLYHFIILSVFRLHTTSARDYYG